MIIKEMLRRDFFQEHQSKTCTVTWHSHDKRKDCIRPYCWYFCWYWYCWYWFWNLLGDRTGFISKQQKMTAFSEDFHRENNFEIFLATFCCYGNDRNASEAVERIATDQKDYCKCSLCVTVCCIAKSINSSKKGWLRTHPA